MPKTKLQRVVFALMSAFVMTYFMVLYNISLSMGKLKNITFLYAIISMWIFYLIAVFVVLFVAQPLAKALAFRIMRPGNDKPALIMLAIQSFTVCFMVAIMAFAATIIQKGFTAEFLPQYLTTVFTSFILAYPLQIFAAGPFVRFLFRNLFRKQLNNNQPQTKPC